MFTANTENAAAAQPAPATPSRTFQTRTPTVKPQQEIKQATPLALDTKPVFVKHSKDGGQTIDKDGLAAILTELYGNIEKQYLDAEVAAFFGLCGVDVNGKLTFEQFSEQSKTSKGKHHHGNPSFDADVTFTQFSMKSARKLDEAKDEQDVSLTGDV